MWRVLMSLCVALFLCVGLLPQVGNCHPHHDSVVVITQNGVPIEVRQVRNHSARHFDEFRATQVRVQGRRHVGVRAFVPSAAIVQINNFNGRRVRGHVHRPDVQINVLSVPGFGAVSRRGHRHH